jgi:hypothetical protein
MLRTRAAARPSSATGAMTRSRSMRSRRSCCRRRLSAIGVPAGAARQQGAGKEFAILVLIEPGAFDIEKAQPGELGERQRINSELGQRVVGARIRFVVEDVDRAVAHLQRPGEKPVRLIR